MTYSGFEYTALDVFLIGMVLGALLCRVFRSTREKL